MLIGNRNSVGFSICFAPVLLPKAQPAHRWHGTRKGTDSLAASLDLWHHQKVGGSAAPLATRLPLLCFIARSALRLCRVVLETWVLESDRLGRVIKRLETTFREVLTWSFFSSVNGAIPFPPFVLIKTIPFISRLFLLREHPRLVATRWWIVRPALPVADAYVWGLMGKPQPTRWKGWSGGTAQGQVRLQQEAFKKFPLIDCD